ncbi:MAG: hypothetical protein QOF56_1095 [Acidobacteriaceae bacterium]|jgi:hypothetical protein|nr:hypothetical protein [Acidobacteriaceae bacterium]
MDSESKTLTLEEFVSLLVVGNGCAITDLPSVIPAEHSARLIALGFIVDLYGSLRMTAPGRLRITVGFENKPLPDLNQKRRAAVTWSRPPSTSGARD